MTNKINVRPNKIKLIRSKIQLNLCPHLISPALCREGCALKPQNWPNTNLQLQYMYHILQPK